MRNRSPSRSGSQGLPIPNPTIPNASSEQDSFPPAEQAPPQQKVGAEDSTDAAAGRHSQELHGSCMAVVIGLVAGIMWFQSILSWVLLLLHVRPLICVMTFCLIWFWRIVLDTCRQLGRWLWFSLLLESNNHIYHFSSWLKIHTSSLRLKELRPLFVTNSSTRRRQSRRLYLSKK